MNEKELKVYKYNYFINHPALSLTIILLLAAVIRIIFFSGLVFSDDSYYDQLAYSFYSENYGSNFLGYPILLVRKLATIFTSFSFIVFGQHEISSVVFPFLFSLGSIVFIFKIAQLISNDKKTSFTAAFLLAFFPIDIVFATLNFVDLQAAFFINAGLYFILYAHYKNDYRYSIAAGFLFAASIFIKASFYYAGILLLILFIYFRVKQGRWEKFILSALIIVVIAIIAEGIIYSITQGSFFYRLNILESNYRYSYYNFFPNNILIDNYSGEGYISVLFEQIFLMNFKHLLLRRFYLFVPFAAMVISVLYLPKKKHILLIFWYVGLFFLLAMFTTSFSSYKPLDLKYSWYAYILFTPAIIIFSIFIAEKLKGKYFIVFLLIYFVGSLFMVSSLRNYFGLDMLKELKIYIEDNPQKVLYTDHHTKYGVDLIDSYKMPLRTKSIEEITSLTNQINPGEQVLINVKNINELKMQGYIFPDLKELTSEVFRHVIQFGNFVVYERE